MHIDIDILLSAICILVYSIYIIVKPMRDLRLGNLVSILLYQEEGVLCCHFTTD